MSDYVPDPYRCRFVGDDFRDFVHPSLFGAFAMVVRINQFTPGHYFSTFGLRVRRAEDLSRVLTFSQSRRASVQAALGLPPSVGTLEPWLPFQCDTSVFENSWTFRFCASCLRVGFHTLLHQLPWVQRCPWHGDRLREHCRRCSRPMTLNGAGGRPLLQCVCGFEVLNEMAAVAGDPWLPSRARPFLEAYLDWAAERRSRTKLIFPAGQVTEPSVLREIVQLPIELRRRCDDPSSLGKHHTGKLSEKAPLFSTDDLQSALTKLSEVGVTQGGLIEIPAQVEHAFLRVGCDLVNKLPPNTLSDSEMSLFFDGSQRQPSGRFQPAVRKSIHDISWLASRLVGPRRFLSLRCIDPKVGRVASELLSVTVPDGAVPTDSARWQALNAVSRTLLRGYSEGTRTVIARYAPDLFDSRRDRPHHTEPWILVEDLPGSRLIRWVWARAPHLID